MLHHVELSLSLFPGGQMNAVQVCHSSHYLKPSFLMKSEAIEQSELEMVVLFAMGRQVDFLFGEMEYDGLYQSCLSTFA